MGFTIGKAVLTLGDVIKDVGMRGVYTSNTTETVVYSSNLSTANVERVGINLTARNSSSVYYTYAKVRRDAIDGEILLEGTVYGNTEANIGSGVFNKGSGVFVWTLWAESGSTSYLGSRSGLVAGLIVVPMYASSVTIPVKLCLTRLRAASLVNWAIINGFACLAPITYDMPASNTFFSNLTIIMSAVQQREEFVAISMEGWILTIS